MTAQQDPVYKTASEVPVPEDAALVDAVKVMGDAVKNEESRFSNLNTRGVALVSASSVVTALAGFFSKELVAETIPDTILDVASAGVALAVGLLGLSVALIVLGVLTPGGRSVFGSNPLTRAPAKIKSGHEVNRIAFQDYMMILQGLTKRNQTKAIWLNWGYLAFLAAVLTIVVTTILAIISLYSG